MNRLRFITLAAALLVGGCARGINVGSTPPTATYSITVENQTGVAMVVTYNDGRSDAILGSVAAGASERFIIAGSTATSISVRGAAASGNRTSGPYDVTLAAGSPRTVILR
jgi:uncharacterized lipoprotein YajG